jgi:hypothetical protein
MAGNDVARRFYAALGLDLAQVTIYKVLTSAD